MHEADNLAMGNVSNNQILGIVLVILGIVLLVDHGVVPLLGTIIGVVLLVVGILMLMGNLRGATWIAVTCIVLGILILLPGLGVRALATDIMQVVVIVVAVLLIIIGALKIMQKA